MPTTTGSEILRDLVTRRREDARQREDEEDAQKLAQEIESYVDRAVTNAVNQYFQQRRERFRLWSGWLAAIVSAGAAVYAALN